MSHCVRPMTSIGSSHFDMGLNWIPVLGGSLLLLLLLLPAPSLWQGGSPSAGVLVGASVEMAVVMGAAAGAAAVAEEGKVAVPLTELVSVGAGASAGDSAGDAAAEATAKDTADATAEASACSVDLLDASDMFVQKIDDPHKSVMMRMSKC